MNEKMRYICVGCRDELKKVDSHGVRCNRVNECLGVAFEWPIRHTKHILYVVRDVLTSSLFLLWRTGGCEKQRIGVRRKGKTI